jgi:hypothetical protein
MVTASSSAPVVRARVRQLQLGPVVRSRTAAMVALPASGRWSVLGVWVSGCSQEPLFVVDGRLVVESGVEAVKIVPALDELEEGPPGLGVELNG